MMEDYIIGLEHGAIKKYIYGRVSHDLQKLAIFMCSGDGDGMVDGTG